MKEKMAKQSPKHYQTKEYLSSERMSSYAYQMQTILGMECEDVLEVGVGNQIVSQQLKAAGLSVRTNDFNEALGADDTFDIRDLGYESKRYDCVLCAQVLEHLPWKKVGDAVGELCRVSRKYVVLSVPYGGISIDLSLKVRFWNWKSLTNSSLRIRRRFRDIRYGETHSEHYWELGSKQVAIRDFRTLISRHGKIVAEGSPPLNPYHLFFTLSVS